MEKLEGFIGENPMSTAEDLVFIQCQKAQEQAIIREKRLFRALEHGKTAFPCSRARKNTFRAAKTG